MTNEVGGSVVINDNSITIVSSGNKYTVGAPGVGSLNYGDSALNYHGFCSM
jgi:hypothetical protein